MKYKVGDKIKIKSIDWYNHQVKDKDDDIPINSVNYNTYFTKKMSDYCSKEAEIVEVSDNCYTLDVDRGIFEWIDTMFEDTDFEQLVVGEVFNYEGHKLKVKQVNSDYDCTGCFFHKLRQEDVGICSKLAHEGKQPECSKSNRIDGNSVVFREVKDNKTMEERSVKIHGVDVCVWGEKRFLTTLKTKKWIHDPETGIRRAK